MDAVDQHGWSEAVVDILVEFLEAATHSLLHARRAYPQGGSADRQFDCFECLNV